MAKVKLEGVISFEFEVKYGLSEDVVIKVHEIPMEVGGEKCRVLVGEGEIGHIPEKTLRFIGERIEGFLKKQKGLLGVDGLGDFFRYGYIGWMRDAGEYVKALRKNELGKLMLDAYRHRKRRRWRRF
jgi:hypothetical protein